jgi:hypothetical protein
MISLELRVEEQAYVLSILQEGRSIELSRMAGGAQHLLPGPNTPTEAQLEVAIEKAENWLMPHVLGLNGQMLHVADSAGRLTSGLLAVLGASERSWSLAAIEQAFVKVVDLATGRHAHAALSQHRLFVADLLVVRELAHHGQVSGVRLSKDRYCAQTAAAGIED